MAQKVQPNATTGDRSRLPTLTGQTVDRLNLEQALRDFEIANARVVDLTSRLTLMNERQLDLQHQLSLARLEVARVADLQAQCNFLIFERDAARDQARALELSRSFRVGSLLMKVGRRILP